MKDYLFVCGTLRSEYVEGEIAAVMKRLQTLGAASVRGKLYNLGAYPGAVVDQTANTSIHGELFELPPDETTLQELDKYEDFDPAKPEECLFVRRRAKAELIDGHELEAWIYTYNRDPKGAPLIEGGKWKK